MKKANVVLAVLGSIAFVIGGCSKSLDGTTYNYASGNLSATLAADVQKSYDASLKAVDELQLPRSENVKDALGARIAAKTSADKKVTISLTRISDDLTAIVIEVGMVGDKDISRTIYGKIVENLNKTVK